MDFVNVKQLVGECKYEEPDENTTVKNCFLNVEMNLGKLWKEMINHKKTIKMLEEKDKEKENQLSLV